MEKSKTNPNKVNQYTDPDPRQALFLSYYLDPKSTTFSNCQQSGLKAGYTEEYAKVITSQLPDWLSSNLKDSKRLQTAEKNLDEFLDMKTENIRISNGEEYLSTEPALVKIKADVTKFTLERLNKEKYSARKELTGKDGTALVDLSETESRIEDLLKTYGAKRDQKTGSKKGS